MTAITPQHTKTVRGVEVPSIGLGTWQVTGRDCVEAVADALALGYRHVDTAAAYSNEQEVGRGLRKAGVEREAVWITSKVWMDELEPAQVRASAERSLRALGVERLDAERLDLLLIHWPPADERQLAPALEELVHLRDDGRIRELGVSNFPPYLLERALEITGELFANQVEYHAHLPQEELLAVCERADVLLEAYAPIGSGHGGLLDEPLLREIAQAHGATPAQVALAWLLAQERVLALPRSRSHERRAENLAALELALSAEERARIDELAAGRRRRYFDPSWAPDWRD